jgi:hypothetical protein
MWYLDDVDGETHCLSLVPESVTEKRALPTVLRPPPAWERGEEVEVDPLKGPSQQRSTAWDEQSDAAWGGEDGRL